MSQETIIKRTRFCFTKKDGAKDYSHFAQVVTTKGTMVEPFTPEMRGLGTASAYDPSDEMVRVDEEIWIQEGREKACLSPVEEVDGDGSQALHGGLCWLRG